MSDRRWIVAGVIVFLGLLSFPVWYNLAAGTTPRPPDLRLPEGEKACVAPAEYMRRSHMDLLLEWRDKAVREQERTFVAFDGRSYTRSLTQTCLGCHASKAEFCDRCHGYADVKLTCWGCHVDPKDPRAAPRRLARSDPR